jgi:SAM-dependent methyltransferase
MRGFTLWLKKNCPGYHPTGFFINQPFGTIVNGIENENLEQLTLTDESVDIWLHLDVLEHLFDPFLALREIFRTLKVGGLCVFTVPTYPERVKSEQVAWQLPDGSLKIIGKPEYHGNPQQPENGALVTWRYGYDLPLLIQRETGFDVEVRRWQSREIAVMGTMTEVYICRKPAS